MPEWFINLCGWLPAIIFPGASGLQLITLIRAESAAGVSLITWSLFSLANIAAYIYLEKYLEPQALLLLTAAFIQAGIVLVAFRKSRSA